MEQEKKLVCGKENEKISISSYLVNGVHVVHSYLPSSDENFSSFFDVRIIRKAFFILGHCQKLID